MSSIPLRSPVTFTFNPHHGPVHAVDCSRFHRHAFVSSGQDQCLRIYNLLQVSRIIIVVVIVDWNLAAPISTSIYSLLPLCLVIIVVVIVDWNLSASISTSINNLPQVSLVIIMVVIVDWNPISTSVYSLLQVSLVIIVVVIVDRNLSALTRTSASVCATCCR